MELSLPGGHLRIPREGGFTMKSGACAILPFNLDMRGFACNTPPLNRIATLDGGGTLHYFFFAHDGIAAEYSVGRAHLGRGGGDCGRGEEDGLLLMRPGPGSRAGFPCAAPVARVSWCIR